MFTKSNFQAIMAYILLNMEYVRGRWQQNITFLLPRDFSGTAGRAGANASSALYQGAAEG